MFGPFGPAYAGRTTECPICGYPDCSLSPFRDRVAWR
jgi:hypothetical protein